MKCELAGPKLKSPSTLSGEGGGVLLGSFRPCLYNPDPFSDMVCKNHTHIRLSDQIGNIYNQNARRTIFRQKQLQKPILGSTYLYGSCEGFLSTHRVQILHIPLQNDVFSHFVCSAQDFRVIQANLIKKKKRLGVK